jgi:hypothetical protein
MKSTSMWNRLTCDVQSYLFDNDDMFIVPGWRLDSSWVLCTVGAAASVLCAVGLAASAYLLPPEKGYALLRDSARVRNSSRA